MTLGQSTFSWKKAWSRKTLRNAWKKTKSNVSC